MSQPGEITQLLIQLRNGDRGVEDQLIPLVYEELRRLARSYMRKERPGHTLQPTALVHEAYVRLVRQQEVDWQGRAHFFAVSARLMRRILVDHWRRKKARGWPSRQYQVPLDGLEVGCDEDFTDLLVFDDALERLTAHFPRQGSIVELRFFGGLSEAQIAETLGYSVRTVKSDWRAARAWLFADLSSHAKGSGKVRTKAV